MFFNFKKSILSQKRRVFFALLFCALFSLFFPSVLFAAADEEFAKLENQLKEKTLKPDEFLVSIIQVNIEEYSYEKKSFVVNDSLLKRRDELICLSLDSGANANQFLGVVVSRQLVNQEDLIKIVLDKGAEFSDAKIEYLGTLPSLELAKQILDSSFDPNKFLELIVQANVSSSNNEKGIYGVDNELVKRRNELIELALSYAEADKNEFLGMVVSRQPVNQEDLVSIALAKGAKFSDIKIEYLNSLPSLGLARRMLDNSFDPNKFLELVTQANLESYNSEKMVFEINNDLLKRRNELVELALGYVGADKNDFLGMIVSRQPVNQEDLVSIALAKGAKFSDIKIGYLNSLPSLGLAKQILDGSFDPNKFLELIVQANVSSSNNEKGIYGVDNELVKRRNELVELALDYAGADKNEFLGMVVNRQPVNQEDLINIALAKGAKVSDVKIEYLNSLPSLGLAKQILDGSFDPNKFLELVINVSVNSTHNEKGTYEVDNDLIKRRNELVQLALGYAGADKNGFLGMVVNRQPVNQEDLINIALAKGAKVSDVKIEYLNSLPSLGLAKQILDGSFDPNKFLELVMNVGVNGTYNENGIYGADNDLIKRRNELVELALGYAGADKNEFLGMVVNRQPVNQEDLINIALAKGAKFSDMKIEYLSSLPSLELAMQILDNSFDATSFLNLILEVPPTHSYSEFLSKQTELVIFALKKGADPNRLIQTDELNDLDLDIMVINPKILELLFNNEYKKIDPNLFCKWLAFAKAENSKEKVEYSFDSKYKNLAAKAGLVPRIPRILHQIWVTNSERRREISAEDIQHILDAEKVFLQSGQKWEHIVWTNDKSLIPISVEKLESNGIKVREISEIENHLKYGEKVRELIEQEEWGMASDLFRYDIVYYMGGVYADVNFVFTRDVESEIYKYDFFNHSVDDFDMENSFFGAKAHHPILGETLSLVDENLNHPSKYLVAVRQKKSRKATDITTYIPFNVAYYKAANNGTVDVMYPAHYKESPDQNIQDNGICVRDSIDVIKKYTNCEQCLLDFYREQKKLYEHTEDRDICGTEEHVYGHDTSAGSWINK